MHSHWWPAQLKVHGKKLGAVADRGILKLYPRATNAGHENSDDVRPIHWIPMTCAAGTSMTATPICM